MNTNLIHSTSGIELLRKLAENGKLIFTSKEASKISIQIGISPAYIRQVLHHLERTHWIIRLKNGLYSLSSVLPGITPLHEFQIAMALIQPAAISHWSALNYHGMTEQVPRQIFVLTPAKSLPRLRKKKTSYLQKGYPIGSAIYQFVQIKPMHYFGIKDIWVNETIVKITDHERTLLDCLMFPEYAGGFFEVLHAFERNISKINIEKIVEYALKLDTATIKRLGWILSSLEVDYSKIERLQKAQIKGYRLLDKTCSSKGKYNAQWMILENLVSKTR